MRIISSDLALRLLVALRAGGQLSLTKLSEAVEKPVSSVQAALRMLQSDGVVVEQGGSGRSRRHRLAETAVTEHLYGLASSVILIRDQLSIAARSLDAVEFMACLGDEVVVMLASTASALEESEAARAINEVCESSRCCPRYLYHGEIRRELLADPDLRTKMAASDILYGDLDHSFPDRRRHGMTRGRPLRRAHPSVKLPSRRLARHLAARHRLASLRLFGSAARTDFRPDSDIDIAIRYRSGVEPNLRSLREIEQALERATGRDVEVVDEASLDPDVLERVEREAVSLL